MVRAAAIALVASGRSAGCLWGTEGAPGNDNVRASIGLEIVLAWFFTENRPTFWPTPHLSVEAERERRLQVVAGVGTEGDVGLGRRDALDLVEPVRDHLGDILVAADPHHHDQVHLTGHRVDLADPFEGRDRL